MVGELHNEGLRNLVFTKYYQGEEIKKDEVGDTFSTHWVDEECNKNCKEKT